MPREAGFLETIPCGVGSLLEKSRIPCHGKGETDEGNGPLARHIGRMGFAADRCVALSGCFHLTQAQPDGRGRVRERDGQGQALHVENERRNSK